MNESLYTEAIKALIGDKGFYSYQTELLISSQTYWDKMPPDSIEKKKLVFVHSNNEETLLKENDNVIEILNLEPPKIDGDELIVKINHTLCVTTRLSADENSWSKKLTDKDKNQIKDSIKSAEGNKEFTGSNSISLAIMNKWTYAKFKFDNADRRFKIIGLETKFV